MVVPARWTSGIDLADDHRLSSRYRRDPRSSKPMGRLPITRKSSAIRIKLPSP